ncbi:MAG TPA: M20 family metallopeptidase [Saprospiraceae bacterium]|nr:M20 family metallopeptidase [Saprospiraceae bacterium]
MKTNLIDSIKNKASEYLPEIIKIRRHLHKYPELSFDEKNTSDYIVEILTNANIPFTTGWGGHGLVANIDGSNNGQVIALRADMDGLPIFEENNVPYKSANEGVMHACGHDVHMSCLIGAAFILNDLKDSLGNNYRLIFQPGEEKLPGGASLLISEGVLQNPIPKSILGQHVFPSMEVGKVGIRTGLYMASSDEIYIEVNGKGGHAAMPNDIVDTILASSQILIALQQIVSRKSNPAIPTVLSFGKINSVGGATNVIPNKILIEGTFRTMDENWRKEAHNLIVQIARHTASSYGATCEVRIENGYPCLINDHDFTLTAKGKMVEYLGKENVVDLPIRMTSEDFAFYSQVIPACFYRLGTGNAEKGIVSPVHTSTFDIDESALEIGMGLMAWLAIEQ